MLEELGILVPREEYVESQQNNLFNRIQTKEVRLFILSLKKRGSAKQTILHYLIFIKKLEDFSLDSKNNKSLLNLEENQIREFTDYLFSQKQSYSNKRRCYLCLKHFYRWLYKNKLIPINIYPKIVVNRPSAKIVICSEDQYFKLRKYIKSPDSNPENALLITLSLFFALTPLDIAQSQILINDNQISIKLKRRPLTKGKKYYRRLEILKIPITPSWLKNLQIRFIKNWKEHYKKVKKTFPQTPLILPKSNISNRFLSSPTVYHRI